MKLAIESISNPALPSLQGQTGVGFFGSIIPRFVGLALLIGVLVFFFVMIAGAIQWISSGGDKAAVEAARGKIVNAVVGVVVLLALFAAVQVLEGFFGINILTLDIGPLKIQ